MPYSIPVIWHIVLTGRQSSRRIVSKTDPYMCVEHTARQMARLSRKTAKAGRDEQRFIPSGKTRHEIPTYIQENRKTWLGEVAVAEGHIKGLNFSVWVILVAQFLFGINKVSYIPFYNQHSKLTAEFI